MTLAEQIEGIRRENKQEIDRTFKNISSDVGRYVELEGQKAETARAKLEYIEEISKELGVISGDYVKEEKSRLINEIKSNILKDRKVFGKNFGKTVDLSKLASFEKDIQKLGNLAETSRVVDQFYKMNQQKIEQSKFMKTKGKSQAMNELMKTLVDKDTLENFSFDQLSQELDGIVRRNTDPLLLMNEEIGKQGMKTVTYTNSLGGQSTKTVPQFLDIDARGRVIVKPEDRVKLQAYASELSEAGYPVDPQSIVDRYAAQFDTSVGTKENIYGKKELTDAQLNKAKEVAKEQPEIALDVLSRFLVSRVTKQATGGKVIDTDTERGLGELLRANGINYEIIGNKIKISKNGLSEVAKGFADDTGIQSDVGGYTFDIESLATDQAVINSFLIKQLQSKQVKGLETNPIILNAAGIYFPDRLGITKEQSEAAAGVGGQFEKEGQGEYTRVKDQGESSKSKKKAY